MKRRLKLQAMGMKMQRLKHRQESSQDFHMGSMGTTTQVLDATLH